MSILSKFSIAAANFDFEVKKIFRSLFEVATIAAAGSSNTDATALTAGKNLVTTADGTKGVILPVAEPEMEVTVVNTVAASDLKVYPAASAQINALTATTGAFTIPGGQEATFHCDVALHWYVSTGSGASAAELEVLNGASATNATTGKAAILGTGGAVQFGGVVTSTGLTVGNAVMAEADLELIDDLTAGTSAPSKALTTDAAESLVWATTDNTASETVTLSIQDTRTGAGATGWTHKNELVSNVALGAYANAGYNLVTFGATGSVVGLAAGVCGEVELSAGTTSGTYAALEAELTANSAVSTGTDTGFIYGNIAGSNSTGKTTINTNAHLMVLGTGVVDTAGGLFDVIAAPQAVTASARARIKIGATLYYIPLCAAAALTS